MTPSYHHHHHVTYPIIVQPYDDVPTPFSFYFLKKQKLGDALYSFTQCMSLIK